MNDRPLAVRIADAGDAEKLAVLGAQVWLDNYAKSGIHPAIARYILETFTPAKFEAQLADPATMILVAERGRHLIGFAIVALGQATALVPVEAPAQAEIDRLYVQEPFCNAGVGARLVEAIEDALRARGIAAVWLEAWVENERALHFYAKRGFDDVGTGWFELNGKQHENRVLAKMLAASPEPA